MKRMFIIEKLGCAHCADKIERKILKIEGVKSASISFVTKKLYIEAEEDKFDYILNESQKICSRIDHQCKITNT